ncbi:alpha/beta fold hydrolase [Actinomadura madurae]|uniref:alpha/beta fold hydrolase n=1 Tax=Actinomadura madurae TaxID=1993 RepID=UPI0020D22B8A|nr:alpha/beta hydrolase [Actinomadura madurae]MCP9965550.1 alpha/beta hydrolase [Actinomadura madurae]MCP9978032.1 alpha/beta hydrolase [Actinomadura madurae]MCQ0014227.1 alpha/beta hydrolase [Actinomadura madurae]
MSETRFLDLPGGRLAYDDTGDGPLVVCLPSMLDLRSQYRFLRPLLLQAGYRVVTVDQRGMGETSATWPEYGSTPLAHDLMALLRHLDAGPALVYGCSNGAAAGVWVAAEAPELVSGLVLAAPFVRDGKAGFTQKLTIALARIPGLAVPLYMSYYPKWEPKPPADFAEHAAKLRANFKEPGRGKVIAGYLSMSHAESEARLDRVQAPVLVIMGTGDIDWPDPAAEARWVAQRLNGEVVLLDGAGHHPHVEYPEKVADAVTAFQKNL